MTRSDLIASIERALFTSFSRRLFSIDGSEGISSLVQRALASWDALTREWLDCEVIDGYRRLGTYLRHLVTAIDRNDLRAIDIPLRQLYHDESRAEQIVMDANICAKLIYSLLEVLANEEPAVLLQTLNGLVDSDVPALAYGNAYFANLILIDFFSSRDLFDDAISAADKILTRSVCITAQELRFRALKMKRTACLAGSQTEPPFDLENRFCSQPFESLASTSLRDNRLIPGFYACQCPGTLPYSISNGKSGNCSDDIWNGPEIREIRRSILDGDFSYCNKLVCPSIVAGVLPLRDKISDPTMRSIVDGHLTVVATPPKRIVLAHDSTCNLACPSCRNGMIVANEERRLLMDQSVGQVLLPLLENASVVVNLTSDGDPFASKHYRNLISRLDPVKHANVGIEFLTNGLLLTEREWMSLGHVRHMIRSISVSIDAARRQTYEDVRRPGKWTVLEANMEFLAQVHSRGEFPYFQINFVVQDLNFEEMPEFVTLGKQWGVNRVQFMHLNNIGTFSPQEYASRDVSSEVHPRHHRFMDVLRHEFLSDPIVDMFDLTPLWLRATENGNVVPA